MTSQLVRNRVYYNWSRRERETRRERGEREGGGEKERSGGTRKEEEGRRRRRGTKAQFVIFKMHQTYLHIWPNNVSAAPFV